MEKVSIRTVIRQEALLREAMSVFPDRAGKCGEERKQGALDVDNKEVMLCFVYGQVW